MIFSLLRMIFRRRSLRKQYPTLRSVPELHRILAVERASADRTGQALSLILFTPRTPEQEDQTIALLARILPTRLRITDAAGWLDSRHICAVLPFSPAVGAWKVADDICLMFPEEIAPPICEVFSYPSGNFPTGHFPVGRSDSNPSKTPLPGGNSYTRDVPTASQNGYSDSGRMARPTASLERLLLRPFPWWKRAIDLVGASLGMLVLLPLLPIFALLIKLTSRGPVFFRQTRTGWGGQPFRMWKFRTMVVDAEAKKAALMNLNEQDGPAFKIKADPRITRVGRFLRCTSFDELPQLWNVIRGEMSLVGPRPLPVAEANACEPWQRRRLDVKPGLTCIWQVRGRSSVLFAEWIRMDLQYIERHSMWEDLKLIALTVPAMALHKGAH